MSHHERAPERPPFRSGLPPQADLSRPHTVPVISALILVAAAAFVVFTVRASLRVPAIRKSLEATAADETSKYSASDIATAVNVALVGALVLGVVLVGLQLLSARRIHTRREGSRALLVFLTIVGLPTIVATHYLRDAGPAERIGSTLQGGALLAACIIAFFPSVSRWLSARPVGALNLIDHTTRPPDPLS